MLIDSWPEQNGRKPKYDFVVYYNEELERNVPVFDPNRLPEFFDALKRGPWYTDSRTRFLYQSLLDDGEPYNADIHEGHIRCPDGCGAHMKFKEAEEGKASKFKLDKNGEQSRHKDICKYKSEPRSRRIDIDSTASRSLIDTHFNQRSSNHISHQIHHALTREAHEDLIGRKVKKAATAADFLKMLEKGDLAKDVFVDQYQIIKAQDFFIRDAKDIRRLYSNIEETPGETRFRAVMFRVSQSADEMKPSETMSISSHTEFYYQQSEETKYDGPKHFITPRVLPEFAGTDSARACFPAPGTYLVVGDVKKGPVIDDNDNIIHYMDIVIRSPDQVIAVGNKADLKLSSQSRAYHSQRGLVP